jgi:hypothetical protein
VLGAKRKQPRQQHLRIVFDASVRLLVMPEHDPDSHVISSCHIRMIVDHAEGSVPA